MLLCVDTVQIIHDYMTIKDQINIYILCKLLNDNLYIKKINEQYIGNNLSELNQKILYQKKYSKLNVQFNQNIDLQIKK